MDSSDPASAASRDAEAVPLADLDVSRPERFLSNTHGPYFARLRREEPVHYCRRSAYGPYWSITRLDDIIAIEADHIRFSSDGNVIIGDVPAMFDDTRAFATSDPPAHTCERTAVLPAVSTKRVAALEAATRAHIGAVLDSLPAGDTFDWVQRVSVELTTQMVALLFDFPWHERELLPYWSEVLMTAPQPGQVVDTPAARDAVLDEYRRRMLDLWRERAMEAPRDDIISLLAHNSGTSTMAENPSRLMGIVALIAGANEAARGALSGCVVAFDQFPCEWETLSANRSLAANAAAEIIRWQSPIAHMRRTATQDVQFRGRHIRKGDRVVMWYCSANRDETYFDAGESLRVDRHNARRHLAFGSGIHRCVGLHVATMQLRVLLEEMLARFARIEVVAEPKRMASNFSAGYEEVLVRVRP